MTCDEHQARYLAAGPEPAWAAPLARCEACRVAQPDLDGLRRRLGDPGLWQSPDPAIEDRVVASITGTPKAGSTPAKSRGVWAIAAVAAMLTLLAGVVTVAGSRPDWDVGLAAVEAPPGASAVMSGWNTESGTRLRLEVEGIDPLDPGFYYEIWLTSADGSHVSAGTFRSSGTIDAWVAVTRADFPRIRVTVGNGSDPGPSARVLFDT